MRAAADRDTLTPADARALNRASLAIERAGRQLRELSRLEPADSHPRRLTRAALMQLQTATAAIRDVATRHPDLEP